MSSYPKICWIATLQTYERGPFYAHLLANSQPCLPEINCSMGFLLSTNSDFDKRLENNHIHKLHQSSCNLSFLGKKIAGFSRKDWSKPKGNWPGRICDTWNILTYLKTWGMMLAASLNIQGEGSKSFKIPRRMEASKHGTSTKMVLL